MSPSHRSEADFRVVHALRCIGVAGEERVATASGLGRRDTAARLRRLSSLGLVTLAPGPFGGWGLTEAGRASEQDWLRVELELTGARDHIHRSYRSFLALNSKLLQICSDWQMIKLGPSPILNDHRDPEYDAGVLSRLMKIEDSVQRILAELSGRLSRFESYGSRLRNALERTLAGDTLYLADGLDSYHAVWFQLHEDLLATLGISRDEERRDTSPAGS